MTDHTACRLASVWDQMCADCFDDYVTEHDEGCGDCADYPAPPYTA